MRRRLVLAGAAALTGCSLLPAKPYVQQRDWPLDVRREPVAQPNPRRRVLLVRDVRAGPGLEVRGLQWLERDGSVHVDFYEQWAVPPAQAVEDDLRQWLADSGQFRAVVAPGSRLNADFVLEAELDVFIADLKAGVARVALALVLLDQGKGSTKVLLQRTESAEVRLAGNDPPAVAEAMKAALVAVLGRTETDVAAVAR
jgi:cholesterol transport system auxiliary component